MGKHSIEKPKKKINLKKELLAVIIIIALVFGINFILSHREAIIEKQENETLSNSGISIINSKTIQGQKLVIKSNSDYNKIIEYTFENNVLKTVRIYEQFETKETFEPKKQNYEMIENIKIINVNEQELSIEIEKKDFGSDTGKTYEEIYDKYLVQIIGAYQIVK